MDYKKIVVEIEGKRYALVPLEAPPAETSLDDVEMPGIARNALKAAGVTHLEQLLEMTEPEIFRVPAVGRKAINALREALAERGWRIGQFHHEP